MLIPIYVYRNVWDDEECPPRVSSQANEESQYSILVNTTKLEVDVRVPNVAEITAHTIKHLELEAEAVKARACVDVEKIQDKIQKLRCLSEPDAEDDIPF